MHFCCLLLRPNDTFVCFSFNAFFMCPIRTVHLNQTTYHNHNEYRCQHYKYDLSLFLFPEWVHMQRFVCNSQRFIFIPCFVRSLQLNNSAIDNFRSCEIQMKSKKYHSKIKRGFRHEFLRHIKFHATLGTAYTLRMDNRNIFGASFREQHVLL